MTEEFELILGRATGFLFLLSLKIEFEARLVTECPFPGVYTARL